MSIVPALRRWGKGDQFKVILSHSELKASLAYVRSCLEERKEREENEKKDEYLDPTPRHHHPQLALRSSFRT